MVYFNDFNVWTYIKNTWKIHETILETEIPFKYSALLFIEKQFNDFFLNSKHLPYNICFEKAYFILTKKGILSHCVDFCVIYSIKIQLEFIVKSMFFISVCFRIVNSKEVWKNNKSTSSQGV